MILIFSSIPAQTWHIPLTDLDREHFWGRNESLVVPKTSKGRLSGFRTLPRKSALACNRAVKVLVSGWKISKSAILFSPFHNF